MNNKNHFSGRVLVAAAKVKDTIDQKFDLVTTTPLMQPIKCPFDLKWKNAETFALELKVNRKELQAAFKYYYKKGINEYQAERKIEAARILLSKGEMTKKEIAIELDFDQEYFSSVFKKRMGMTPTEWQNKEWERKNILGRMELSKINEDKF
jgi:AraC-like DNA-binding protein